MFSLSDLTGPLMLTWKGDVVRYFHCNYHCNQRLPIGFAPCCRFLLEIRLRAVW